MRGGGGGARPPEGGGGAMHTQGVLLEMQSMGTAGLEVKRGSTVEADLYLAEEVRILSQKLRHPHLTEILGVAKGGPSLSHVLSVSSTVTLAHKTDTLYSLNKPADPAQAALWFAQAVQGLAHLHSHGLVVGTLCPSRFAIDSTGFLKITDYVMCGLGHVADGCIGGDSAGASRYLAPEVVYSDMWPQGGAGAPPTPPPPSALVPARSPPPGVGGGSGGGGASFNSTNNTAFAGAAAAVVHHPTPLLAPKQRRKGITNASTWGVGGVAGDAWALGVVFLELLLAPTSPWTPKGMDFLLQRAFGGTSWGDLVRARGGSTTDSHATAGSAGGGARANTEPPPSPSPHPADCYPIPDDVGNGRVSHAELAYFAACGLAVEAARGGVGARSGGGGNRFFTTSTRIAAAGVHATDLADLRAAPDGWRDPLARLEHLMSVMRTTADAAPATQHRSRGPRGARTPPSTPGRHEALSPSPQQGGAATRDGRAGSVGPSPASRGGSTPPAAAAIPVDTAPLLVGLDSGHAGERYRYFSPAVGYGVDAAGRARARDADVDATDGTSTSAGKTDASMPVAPTDIERYAVGWVLRMVRMDPARRVTPAALAAAAADAGAVQAGARSASRSPSPSPSATPRGGNGAVAAGEDATPPPTTTTLSGLNCIALDNALRRKQLDTAALPGDVRRGLYPRSATLGEDRLARAYEDIARNPTDLSSSLAFLHNVASDMCHARTEARGAACVKLVNAGAGGGGGHGGAAGSFDTARVASVLSFFTKKLRSQQESTVTILKDRERGAIAARPAAPLLFRTPNVCSAGGGGARAVLDHTRQVATTAVPSSWFLSLHHTALAVAEPLRVDSLESVGGYNNAYVGVAKPTEGVDGDRRGKTRLSETVLDMRVREGGFGRGEARATAVLRGLLLRYPATRDDVVRAALKLGVPAALRGEVWGAALGVGSWQARREEYRRINTAQSTADDDQVAKDVPRCHQYDPALASEKGRRTLARVLKAWVIATGPLDTSRYIQGMASLAAPCIALCAHEEPLAYALYASLLTRYSYLACDPSQGYSLLRSGFYTMVAYHDAAVWAKIASLEVPDDVFLSRLRTHFAHDLPLQKIYPLWDALLLGPAPLLFAVAAALLAARREVVLQCQGMTEATTEWKNVMLEISVPDILLRAKRMLRATPQHLSGPPEHLNNAMLRADPFRLPIAWLPSTSPCIYNDHTVWVDTSALPSAAQPADVRVPLSETPMPDVVDRLALLLTAPESAGGFAVGKSHATPQGVSIAIWGYVVSPCTWGPPPRHLAHADTLAHALAQRGFSRVVVVSGAVNTGLRTRRTRAPPARPYCLTTSGALPASLPAYIWRGILECLAPEDLIEISGVCRGAAAVIEAEQQAMEAAAAAAAAASDGSPSFGEYSEMASPAPSSDTERRGWRSSMGSRGGLSTVGSD